MARCTYAWITLYLPSPPLPADHFIPPPLPPWSSVPSVQSRDPGHCGHPSATRAAAKANVTSFPWRWDSPPTWMGVPYLPLTHRRMQATPFPNTSVTHRTLIDLPPSHAAQNV